MEEQIFPEIDKIFSNLTSIELKIFDLINKLMLRQPSFWSSEIHMILCEDELKLEADDIEIYGPKYPGTLILDKTVDDEDNYGINFIIRLAILNCIKRLFKVGVLKFNEKSTGRGCFEHRSFCATQDETCLENDSPRVQYFRKLLSNIKQN